jgi:hypothetical protein
VNVTGAHEIVLRPRRRLVLSMHPYLPIEKNEDGTGGGIIARVYGASGDAYFLRIEWGKGSEIEIVVDG